MDVIPAIDIMGGNVVRLEKGDPKIAKSYEHLGDPVSLAKKWEADGAQIIHVVDLDAALGTGSNINIIDKILRAVKVKVQVGGGIRDLQTAEVLFKKGVYRAIIGSVAFEQTEIAKALLEEFGENRLIVALDYMRGSVMVRGWKTSTGITVEYAIKRLKEEGFKNFFVTSVERDGTLSGPDFETLRKLCCLGANLIVAGGIRSLEDLTALKHLGVNGVVVGKALYEGLFTLSKALSVVRE